MKQLVVFDLADSRIGAACLDLPEGLPSVGVPAQAQGKI